MDRRRPQSRHDFEIAIICALRLERDAIEALLDEDYEDEGILFGKAAGDKNVYTVGRLGNQHVVVAYMPGIGTISAAAVAANLSSSFERIKTAFIVGICGGVPNRGVQDTNQIHLGDVIISTLVVQIDFGRQQPDGFKRKVMTEDILGRADPETRAFIGKLSGYRSKQKLKDKTFSYSAQIASKEGFLTAAYPGPENDILFPSEYRHKHRTPGCKICDKCTNTDDEVCGLALNTSCASLGCQGENPAVRQRSARKPDIHFGRIACGNQVIKSGIHRDQLGKEEGVIGFEMESVGTWDYIPTIVVKSVCDYADSHKSKQWQHYAAATAASCTKAILEEWRSVDQQSQSLPARPRTTTHWTVTRSTSTLFTGRRDILNDLISIIRHAVKEPQGHSPCHIVIFGIGGQGKSEICLQLAHQLKDIFWGVFWVDVSTTTSAENGFLEIASRLGGDSSTWEAARQQLANIEQPWFLILDNADDPDVDYQHYFPSSTQGVVILTSRNSECTCYATSRWINLKGLTLEDAQDLLFQAACIPTTRRESLEADAQAVAQLLQSHPLALIQAGSYIRRGHCSLKDYPQVYNRQRKRLLAFRPVQAQSRYQDVYTTFEASAEIICLSQINTASDALQLLSFLAMFGPNQLPIFLVLKAAWEATQSISDYEVADNNLYAITSWHLERLPIFLETGAAVWDSFRSIEALNLLKAFSLVQIDGEESSLSVSMHPLVHAWARDRLSVEQQHTYWVQAACTISLPGYNSDLWYRHARHMHPHLQAITSWPMSTMFSTESMVQICRILVRCGYLFQYIRDDAKRFELMNLMCTHLNLNPLTAVPQWVGLYLLIAQNNLDSGHVSDAIKVLEQVVRIEERTLAEDHPSRLASQHQLARAYRANGQTQDAVQLLEKVVKIKGLTLQEDHRHRLDSQYELAMAYQANGQTRHAVQLLEEVVKIHKLTLTEDHPSRLASQHVLAMTYRANGQTQDAVQLLEQVVKIEERTLAEDKRHRLDSQHQLAMAYEANGQTQDAVKLLEKVVKIREQTLAEDHRHRLTSQHALAMTYRANGQVQDAVKLLEHVVEIKAQMLAEDHPSRLASQHQLARAYEANGQAQNAVKLLEHVVEIKEQMLVEDHPSRLASQHLLARAYEANGQVQDALQLLEKLVKIEGLSLAKDHPSRLVSQEVLARALWEPGDRGAEPDLMQHVDHVRKQSLRESRPDRMSSSG